MLKHCRVYKLYTDQHTECKQSTYLNCIQTNTLYFVWMAYTPKRCTVSEWLTHQNAVLCLNGLHTKTLYCEWLTHQNAVLCLNGLHTKTLYCEWLTHQNAVLCLNGLHTKTLYCEWLTHQNAVLCLNGLHTKMMYLDSVMCLNNRQTHCAATLFCAWITYTLYFDTWLCLNDIQTNTLYSDSVWVWIIDKITELCLNHRLNHPTMSESHRDLTTMLFPNYIQTILLCLNHRPKHCSESESQIKPLTYLNHTQTKPLHWVWNTYSPNHYTESE